MAQTGRAIAVSTGGNDAARYRHDDAIQRAGFSARSRIPVPRWRSAARHGSVSGCARDAQLRSGAERGHAFNQGMASDEYQNAYNRWAQQNSDIYNRLAGLANTGQQTSNQLAQLSGNYASQYGQNIGQAANARASAYAAKAGANQNMLSDMIGLGSMYYYGKK